MVAVAAAADAVVSPSPRMVATTVIVRCVRDFPEEHMKQCSSTGQWKCSSSGHCKCCEDSAGSLLLVSIMIILATQQQSRPATQQAKKTIEL